jgi:hypothetical protein
VKGTLRTVRLTNERYWCRRQRKQLFSVAIRISYPSFLASNRMLESGMGYEELLKSIEALSEMYGQ